MSEAECMGVGPEEEKKIKIAVESTCELCSSYAPLSLLEVHLISRRRTEAEVKDPSLRVLVACPDCHRQVHSIPVPVKLQRSIAASRRFFIRRDIRKVLGYKPKPYTPPENPDVSQIFEDDYKTFPPPGSYRLSG
jgi:hypothetical protein